MFIVEKILLGLIVALHPTYGIIVSMAIRREASLPNGRFTTREEPVCKAFEADNRSTWDYEASLSTRLITSTVDCTASALPCGVTTSYSKALTWSWDYSVSGEVNVALEDLNFDIGATLGGSYHKTIATTEKRTFYFPPDQQGSIGVTPSAVKIPGWFRECGNGWDYHGQLFVPQENPTFHLVISG